MNTEDIFREGVDPAKKKPRYLQYLLLKYLRTGNTITEEIYKKEIGGVSVSAVIHNLKLRGHLDPGEFIVRGRCQDSKGIMVRCYRLTKETPVPVEKSIESKDIDFSEDDEDDPPVLNIAPPEVESITVGVKGNRPELIIMFKGDEYRPLRHTMTLMESRYLITNLEAFFLPRNKMEEES